MKTRAVVLGCGLVGATMVRDLAADPDFAVTAVDVSAENLRKFAADSRISARQDDLGSVDRVKDVIQDQDIVLGALPSRFGFQTLRAVIESGKPYCDISFMPEDALELDALAKRHGVAAIVDCGVSPGLSNLCIGHSCAQLERAERAVIFVGGVPKVRRWPYDYKAPFSPADVIEEYTRPARLMENGLVVERPALSESELLEFPGVGTLEAFNTDGLRTLLRTVAIPNMKEKTLRYPGHIELMRVFRETGFFGKRAIDVGGVRVRPLDVTSQLLFTKWRLEEGEEELTILRVTVDGQTGGRNVRHTYELYDEYDRSTGTPSMARTTGFPCTVFTRMLIRREIAVAGVLPPELLAPIPGLFDRVVGALKTRGVNLTMRIE